MKNQTIEELQKQYFNWAWASYDCAELAEKSSRFMEFDKWCDIFEKYYALAELFENILNVRGK